MRRPDITVCFCCGQFLIRNYMHTTTKKSTGHNCHFFCNGLTARTYPYPIYIQYVCTCACTHWNVWQRALTDSGGTGNWNMPNSNSGNWKFSLVCVRLCNFTSTFRMYVRVCVCVSEHTVGVVGCWFCFFGTAFCSGWF